MVVVVMLIKELTMICLTGSPDLQCEDDNVSQDHLVASDLGKRTGCFVDGAVHCTWKMKKKLLRRDFVLDYSCFS